MSPRATTRLRQLVTRPDLVAPPGRISAIMTLGARAAPV